MSKFDAQLDKIRNEPGFIAALDQSGGSTPKALRLYGIEEDQYSSEDEMFDLVHQMRTRIITSPAFNGDRILGAILFEMTMDREIEGLPSASTEQEQVESFRKMLLAMVSAVVGETVPDAPPKPDGGDWSVGDVPYLESGGCGFFGRVDQRDGGAHAMPAVGAMR